MAKQGNINQKVKKVDNNTIELKIETTYEVPIKELNQKKSQLKQQIEQLNAQKQQIEQKIEYFQKEIDNTDETIKEAKKLGVKIVKEE